MAVNKVELANGTVLMDSSGVTVTPGDMLTGVTAMSANGQIVTGSLGDFSGTDGTNPGTAGLVPAPTTSDTNTFLCSDGTWSSVSIGIDTSNRQAFSYTVDPSEWLAGVNGEYWTDFVNASTLGISSLELANVVVVSDVLNEDTGLNPQNGYAFGVQCYRYSTNLADPLPNRVRFYYGKGADNAPGNPLTFTGYIEEDPYGTLGGTNIGYYVNGADSGHPVGSIYQSTYNVSPALLFGGTWVRITGQFLLGATDGGSVGTNLQETASVEAGSTGGKATHTLTQSEIPSHEHPLLRRDDNGSESGNSLAYASGKRSRNLTNYGAFGQLGTKDQPHNNMPPFIAVYIWERVG